MALTFRALFQPFGGHEGVGDAGGAGGDADNLQSGGGWSGGRRWRAGEGGFDHRHAIADRWFSSGFINRLVGEAGGVHPGVGGDDDHVGGGDDVLGQGVSRPDRALRLDLDIMSKRLGGLFESFRRHDGVRDAGGAGGDGN